MNEAGRAEAERLAERLSTLRISAVYSGPLERSVETAGIVGSRLGLGFETRRGLDEIEFGEWTGKSFAELDPDPVWRRFNTFRSCTRVPGGESMTEVQARVLAELEKLHEKHPGEAVAVVTHADLIRAALAFFAGIHLDLFHRLEILPASVSIVRLGAGQVQIGTVNNMFELFI